MNLLQFEIDLICMLPMAMIIPNGQALPSKYFSILIYSCLLQMVQGGHGPDTVAVLAAAQQWFNGV